MLGSKWCVSARNELVPSLPRGKWRKGERYAGRGSVDFGRVKLLVERTRVDFGFLSVLVVLGFCKELLNLPSD